MFRACLNEDICSLEYVENIARLLAKELSTLLYGGF